MKEWTTGRTDRFRILLFAKLRCSKSKKKISFVYDTSDNETVGLFLSFMTKESQLLTPIFQQQSKA